jgi:large conductance mechanosensitive channel
MKKIAAEFKSFISRGNVIDMAVGVIMGTAFTAIVNSLVKEVIMPFVGYLISGINFSDLKIVITAASEDRPEVAIAYGSFIQQALNFIIIAAVVFIMVKIINRLRKKDDEKAADEKKGARETPADVALLTEIRDLLRNGENPEEE